MGKPTTNIGPSRRAVLTGLGAAGATLAINSQGRAAARQPTTQPYGADFRVEPLETVRIAFVGVGLQGGSHVKNFLGIEGVDIRAICDIDAPRAEEVAGWVEADGRARPTLYTRGDTDWERLVERDDIDLVFNATPWHWHVPVCVAAMESGKHAAVEVPAATTLDGCWQLVETAERTRRHCVMMENCNYGRSELMTLVMARKGLFGEILHAEGAYIHDLRAIKLSNANEGLWRWQPSTLLDGNLYPTHGLGPVAQVLDINRGDQFTQLVSMSSPARGLSLWARENLPASDPRRDAEFVLGDMNTSLIQTAAGRTIMLQHDTTTPRPYTRLHHIQGTQATFKGFPDRIYVEGRTGSHRWEDLDSYRDEFDHPLWRKLEKQAAGAGHGGMDYLEDYRLIESLRTGTPMDMNVYDAAAISAAVELSIRSVGQGGRPQAYPDFTRGQWKTNPKLEIVG